MKGTIIIIILIFAAAISFSLKVKPVEFKYETKITPFPTVTKAPTPTATPKPTIIPSPTPKPVSKYSPSEIYGFTQSFGGQYGIDPNVIRYIALCESGFNPAAKNYIYGGLFQFDTSTWINFRKKMGKETDPDLRYEAREAVQTAAYAMSLGKIHIWPNCQP